MKSVGLLVLNIKGTGCSSCVMPAKQRILKVRGVIGIFVYGSKMNIIYDPSLITSFGILEKSKIKDYYIVEIIEERRGNYHEILEKVKNPQITLNIG